MDFRFYVHCDIDVFIEPNAEDNHYLVVWEEPCGMFGCGVPCSCKEWVGLRSGFYYTETDDAPYDEYLIVDGCGGTDYEFLQTCEKAPYQRAREFVLSWIAWNRNISLDEDERAAWQYAYEDFRDEVDIIDY